MTKKHWTDRSRSITYQHCKRERFLGYSQSGMGIVAKRMPMRMAVGIAVHEGLAELLRGDSEESAVGTALAEFAQYMGDLDLDTSEQAAMQSTGDTITQLAQSLGLPETDPTVTGLAERVGERRNRFDQYLAREQSALVEACVRAYSRRRLQPLLEQFEVLEVEREGTWMLASHWEALCRDEIERDAELWFMSRPDALLRERSTGELYIQSFKTTGAWDIRKERDAQHDMQGLSEGIEIERRLGMESANPPRIHAIRYEYILTGERWKDKELSAQLEMECRSQRSHLIRCYEAVSVPAKSNAFSIGDVCWSWDYIRPDDMKESSLAWQNWKSRPVWERDGGVKAWIDKLADAAPLMSGEDSTVGMEPRELGYKCDAQAMGVTKQHPLDAAFIPPIVIWRNDDDLRDLVEEMESQEVQIVEHVAQVEAARDEGERRSSLNRYFPRSLRSCHYPTDCQFVALCHGGAEIQRDPLGSGKYKVRVPNHPSEGQP